MKREQQKIRVCNGYGASLAKFWNLFVWRLCLVCREEFRRESGWRHTTHAYRAKWHYVCCKCCPTDQEAYDAVAKGVAEYRKQLRESRPKGL